MQKLNKILLFFLLVATMVIITGCGGNLKTKINMENNLSGVREMVLTVNREENDKYINGDFNSIINLVKSSTPKELEFNAVQDDKNYTLTFKLKFSSLEDYNTKVNALLGADYGNGEKILFSEPTSPFAKGLSYKEEFSSKELLSWFPKLLVESGYIASENESYIFNSSADNQLTYKGQTYNSQYDMSINTIEFLPIERIDLLTKFNVDGTLSRKIITRIPVATMDVAGDEIKKFFAERTSAKAKGEWQTSGAIHIYTVETEDASPEKIDELTSEFFGKNGTKFELKNYQEELIAPINSESTEVSSTEENQEDTEEAEKETNKQYKNVFMLDKHISEKLNLEDFVENEYMNVILHYYVDEDTTVSNLVNQGYDRESVYEGYKHLTRRTYYYIDDIEYDIRKGYTLKDADISLDISSNGSIKRNVVLSYADEISDDALDKLLRDIDNQLTETSIKLNSLEKFEQGFKIDFAYSGETEYTMENNDWVYITNGATPFSTEIILNKINMTTQGVDFKEEISLYPFTDKAIGNINYKVNNIGEVKEIINGFEGENINKSFVVNYQNHSPEESINIEFKSERKLMSVLIIQALAFIAILILVLIVALIILKKRKQKAISGGAVEIQGTTENIDNNKQEEKPETKTDISKVNIQKDNSEHKNKFCTNCGKKIDDNSRFCTSCGEKLE